MSWIYGLVALVAIAFVLWDVFVRGRRGTSSAVSVAAMLILVGSGVARGAGASGAWSLTGLIVGGVLMIIAERVHGATDKKMA